MIPATLVGIFAIFFGFGIIIPLSTRIVDAMLRIQDRFNERND